MSKFYINEQNGRNYYAYRYSEDEVKYIHLSNKDITTFLSSLTNRQIVNIRDKNTYIEVLFDNNMSVLIDDLKIFYIHHDNNDKYFKLFLEKLKRHIERETLKKYSETLPSKYIPKVNRTKKKTRPTAQIIAMSLSITIGISAIAGLLNKEMQKSQQLEEQEFIVYELPNKKIDEIIETNYEIPDNTITLEFENRTESNRVSTELSKLEETNLYFGEYIDKYSMRYGLPRELISAQITQERPNIENGKCDNVCQITYDLFVGQTMTVPIYDESGFTGEYDTFLVTKELLDTPDGNIKVGVAYLRKCVDKFDSLILGLFSYNQGESALGIACEYYGFDKENYLGDKNAIKARDLINRYYAEKGKSHGDSLYLEHVLSYVDLESRNILEYYIGNEKNSVEINNTFVYNSELKRWFDE